MTAISDCYSPILERISSTSTKYLEAVKFNKNDVRHLYLVSMYCSIVEMSYSIYHLYKNDLHLPIPILLRSLVEAYADLINLIADEQYPKRMLKSFLNEKAKLLTNAKKFPDDVFFQSVVSAAELDSEDPELVEMVKDTRAGSIHDKLHDAGLADISASVYWSLCLHSHNNLGILEERHIDIVGDDHRVVLFKRAREQDIVAWLDTLAAIWIDANKRVHEFFATEYAPSFAGLQNSLNHCRRRHERPNKSLEPTSQGSAAQA